MFGDFRNPSVSDQNSDVYKEKFHILLKNFDLKPEQLSKLLNIPISKINNVKDEEITICVLFRLLPYLEDHNST